MSIKTRLPWRMEFARQLLMGETPKTALAWLYRQKLPILGFKFFNSAEADLVCVAAISNR
jgi:hypothetical protein